MNGIVLFIYLIHITNHFKKEGLIFFKKITVVLQHHFLSFYLLVRDEIKGTNLESISVVIIIFNANDSIVTIGYL